jgi:L-lactate dehydrogenase complex protein LldG
MSTAREAVLERVRSALGDVAGGAPAGAVSGEPAAGASSRQPREGERSALLSRFVERVTDYGATVRMSAPEALAATLAALCAERGAERLACPADLPTAWRPPGVELLADDPALSLAELDGVDGVLTGCALAAAETGTVALDHGPGQGRRALTLLPDLHLCVLEASALVPDIPELIAGLGAAVGQRRPVTLISGPSATSDIELDRVEGVHGPRHLAIVLVEPSRTPAEETATP